MERPSSPLPTDPKQLLERIRSDADSGIADAALALGRLYLQGRILPRDLEQARRNFERAAELGSRDAREIAINWQAAGTGGPADWKGAVERLRESAAGDPAAERQIKMIDAMQIDREGNPIGKLQGEKLSERPSVTLFPGFATASECNYLIDMARPLLSRAVIGSPAMTGLGQSQVRTCESMGFPLVLESPFIHALNRRIAQASHTEVLHGEPTQIFRYLPGQEFKPHTDSSPDFPNQRIATFLIYLNDGYQGGETHFIHNDLKVRGHIGDAILFHNVDSEGAADEATKHAGLRVTSGEKWLLSRWIRKSRLTY